MRIWLGSGRHHSGNNSRFSLVGSTSKRITKNMMYTTATCSGRVCKSGNVRIMSVNTLDSGCDQCGVFLLSSALKFGYSGPTTVSLLAPVAANRWRSATASRRMASSGHVASPFLDEGTNCLGEVWADCKVGDTTVAGLECGLLLSSINSTFNRSSLCG